MGKKGPTTKTMERIAIVNKLINEGWNTGAACKKAGIAPSTYYKNFGSNQETPKPSNYEKLVVAEPPMRGTSFLIYGTPAELAEFARALHG